MVRYEFAINRYITQKFNRVNIAVFMTFVSFLYFLN